MYQLPVYAAEREAGLEQLIRSTAAVAFASELRIAEKFVIDERAIARLANLGAGRAKASATDFDLHYLNAVLASCGWNKNDDVFDPVELWLARATAVDKPFNYMHDCADIIGHITASYVIDDDAKTVAEDTVADQLPSKFHVCTGAVLYKYWEKEALQERMDRILAEIAEGKWFVSMECLFKNFDYALTKDGQQKVVARNKDTAFLTKHLRAYGGDGTYQGHKVGRLMRGFVFSGKGLVNKPANPESVIFSETEVFASSASEISPLPAGLVYSTASNESKSSDIKPQESENTMALELADLQKQLADKDAKIESLQAALKDNDVKALTEAKAKVEADLKAKADEAKALSEAKAAVEAELKNLKDEAAKAKLQFEELEKSAKAAIDELAGIKAEQKVTARLKAVAEKLKLEGDAAKNLADSLSLLNDEQFAKAMDAMAVSTNPQSGNTNFPHGQAQTAPKATSAPVGPKSTNKPAPMGGKASETDPDEQNADTSNLDQAKANENQPSLSTSATDNGVSDVQKAIADCFGVKVEE